MRRQITRVISIIIIVTLLISMILPGVVEAKGNLNSNNNITEDIINSNNEDEDIAAEESDFVEKEEEVIADRDEKEEMDGSDATEGEIDFQSRRKDKQSEVKSDIGESEIEEKKDEYYAEKNNLANSWRYRDGERISSKVRSNEYTTWPEVEGAVGYGIDVSYHNGKIDWLKAKNAGVDYAIIRCGYGMDEKDQDDSKWEINADACEKYGIPYGTYIYSYATTTTRAKSEADHVLRLIEGRDLDYPVYFDMEDATVEGLSAKKKGDIAEAFCDKIEAAGYEVAIYANKNWFTNYLTDPRFDQWDKWVAQYNSVCDYEGEYTMWQCSSKGQVDGIKGDVDLNIDYGAEQLKTYTFYETTNTVNYRSGPGTSYTVKGTLVPGVTVSVEEEYSKSANGYIWYRFKSESETYYITSKYLEKKKNEKTYTLYKTTAKANYRSGPGTGYTVKGTLVPGITVSVEEGYSESSNGYIWYRFKSGSNIYYIVSKYLENETGSKPSGSYTATGRANYRSGPGTNYTVKGTLIMGMTVEVDEEYSKSANGYTWYRFKSGSNTYYIASKFLKKATSNKTYVSYKVTARANCRSGPGISYAIKGTLVPGMKISIEEEYSKSANGYTWYRFKSGNNTYYIVSKYLEKETYTPYITMAKTNYRSGPGLDYNIEGKLESGITISVEDGYLESSDGYTWYRFKLQDDMYYIVSKYLKRATEGDETN